MKDSARYVKIVEWSDEDHCYVGSSPGLVGSELLPRILAPIDVARDPTYSRTRRACSWECSREIDADCARKR